MSKKTSRKGRINEEILTLELVGIRAAVAVATRELSRSNDALATVLQRLALNPLDWILKDVS
jgi:hypothetical protein